MYEQNVVVYLASGNHDKLNHVNFHTSVKYKDKVLTCMSIKRMAPESLVSFEFEW